MALALESRQRLEKMAIPGTRETIDALRVYMQRADLSVTEAAERFDYARSTLNLFLLGQYHHVASNDLPIRAAIWDYIRRYPIEPASITRGRLFETTNVRIMREYFTAAVEQGQIALIYGPPGTQKTFTLEHLVAERNRAKKNDAVYVYASADMTATALLKRIGREVGSLIGGSVRERILRNLLDVLTRGDRPSAIVIDEAQHLGVQCLEVARELHDRAGCGLVLAGSHDLFEKFLKSRAQLEQWLSRIDHKEPLPGLLEDEVREIAAAELGNGHPAKLTEKQTQMLVAASRVDDIFARDASGRVAPTKYLSVRRLVKVLAQTKAATKEKAS